MTTRLFCFTAGDTGLWRITSMQAISGEPLASANRLNITADEETPANDHAKWSLRGITSNERYVVNERRDEIIAKQLALGRTEASCAALIPLRKNADWWKLSQTKRQNIFEAQSQHANLGLEHFPTLARRLHHCRDLSVLQPFDFITWFEYTPDEEAAFNTLLAALRATAEWQFVERECDIRLARENT